MAAKPATRFVRTSAHARRLDARGRPRMTIAVLMNIPAASLPSALRHARSEVADHETEDQREDVAGFPGQAERPVDLEAGALVGRGGNVGPVAGQQAQVAIAKITANAGTKRRRSSFSTTAPIDSATSRNRKVSAGSPAGSPYRLGTPAPSTCRRPAIPAWTPPAEQVRTGDHAQRQAEDQQADSRRPSRPQSETNPSWVPRLFQRNDQPGAPATGKGGPVAGAPGWSRLAYALALRTRATYFKKIFHVHRTRVPSCGHFSVAIQVSLRYRFRKGRFRLTHSGCNISPTVRTCSGGQATYSGLPMESREATKTCFARPGTAAVSRHALRLHLCPGPRCGGGRGDLPGSGRRSAGEGAPRRRGHREPALWLKEVVRRIVQAGYRTRQAGRSPSSRNTWSRSPRASTTRQSRIGTAPSWRRWGNCLEQVPHKNRDLLRRRYVVGASYEEIARVLHRTPARCVCWCIASSGSWPTAWNIASSRRSAS